MYSHPSGSAQTVFHVDEYASLHYEEDLDFLEQLPGTSHDDLPYEGGPYPQPSASSERSEVSSLRSVPPERAQQGQRTKVKNHNFENNFGKPFFLCCKCKKKRKSEEVNDPDGIDFCGAEADHGNYRVHVRCDKCTSAEERDFASDQYLQPGFEQTQWPDGTKKLVLGGVVKKSPLSAELQEEEAMRQDQEAARDRIQKARKQEAKEMKEAKQKREREGVQRRIDALLNKSNRPLPPVVTQGEQHQAAGNKGKQPAGGLANRLKSMVKKDTTDDATGKK